MLLNPERGSQNVIVYTAESKASKPQLHMQTFDQYFFVLEGVLTVQLGVEEFDVGARTLVKVPAGVAHTQWNSKGTRERHLVIIAPLPAGSVVDGDYSDVVLKIEAHPQKKRGHAAIY
jgi:mannose-6-phosphate isomerase-like protein (cupin superfamily)